MSELTIPELIEGNLELLAECRANVEIMKMNYEQLRAELAATKASQLEFAKAIVETWKVQPDDPLQAPYCIHCDDWEPNRPHKPDCIVQKAQAKIDKAVDDAKESNER